MSNKRENNVDVAYRAREIVDVTYRVGDEEVTERFNAYWVKYNAGSLIIYDNGLTAAFGPGEWLRVKSVDPEGEPNPTAPA